MPALSFSELSNTKVLPETVATSTGGNSAGYASRQSGGKKQKKSKGKKTSKKTRKTRKTHKTRKSQTKKWFGLF